MINGFAATLVETGSWQWILRLGGPGLILVGLIDNSVIPIPGGMDFFVILLTAHRREWWWYYAIMATAGAVIGGYLTYRLSRQGGKEGLEKKIGKSRAQKFYKKFEKGGFSTVLIGSIIPPPFPIVPVLMAAGVMQYSRHKFLTALSIGRAVRFFIITFLCKLYGTSIVGWLGRYYKPFLYVLIALGIVGGVALLVYLKWYRPRHRDNRRQVQTRKAA